MPLPIQIKYLARLVSNSGGLTSAPGACGGRISVNSSRAILYTSSGADFAAAARAEAIRTRNLLNTASSPR